MNPFHCHVDDASRVAEVRREAVQMAERSDLSADQVGRVALVASELSSNLVKHAQRGEIMITALSDRGQSGIEMLAIDRGPGFSNLGESIQDGVSSTGTAGTGLGAIRRLSDEFDIHSQRGMGTVIFSQIGTKPLAARMPQLMLGVAGRAVSGEPVSGDSWAARLTENHLMLMVADGLGHGVFAHEASRAASDAFVRSEANSPVELVEVLHRALRGTRGAAVAVAMLEFNVARVRFAGLGNIAGVVVSAAKSYSMISHNGTAGHQASRIKEFVYPWTKDSVLVMHSDGLSSNWNPASNPGLFERHSSLIAGLLYRDASRDRDDACVVVGKLL